ncbi:unnamed protein product [Adineta steineri]|uniref:Transmembrane protein n=1 Tax=Adineta steineri TaxID=433720 RepID=A0A818S6J1_9BILA|nr:unnamed protein product [Adineta steineri]CAF3659110.1 unnamed protein product [Adineta steineri]
MLCTFLHFNSLLLLSFVDPASSKTTAVRHRELAHAREVQIFIFSLIVFLLVALYLICLKQCEKSDGEGNTEAIVIPMQLRRTSFETPLRTLPRLEPRTTENNNSNVERTTTSAQQQTSDLPPAYNSVVEESGAIIIIQQQSLLPPTYETFMERNNEREETDS